MAHTNETPSGGSDAPRPSRLGPRLAQLLSALIGITALLAFIDFLFIGPWQLLDIFRGTTAVLAFDACLSAAFFAQHSGMIRRSFKAWLASRAPEHYHGAIYSIAAGICLFCVVLFWQQAEPVLLSANDPLRLAMRALFLAALGGIIWSNLALRSFDVFGLQALRCHLRGTSPPAACFTERGPYRWVRHPQYFFVLLMIWSYPDLTADRLLFNVLWSTWIVAGTLLEERDLAVTLGEPYRDYQARVPMLIPWRVPR